MKKIIMVSLVVLSFVSNSYGWNGNGGGGVGSGGGSITAGIWTPDIPFDIADI